MAALAEKTQKNQIHSSTDVALTFHGLTIHPYKRQVFWNRSEIPLSYLEFETLLYLTQHPGRVLTKRQIYQHLYDEEPVRGVGYKFQPLLEE